MIATKFEEVRHACPWRLRSLPVINQVDCTYQILLRASKMYACLLVPPCVVSMQFVSSRCMLLAGIAQRPGNGQSKTKCCCRIVHLGHFNTTVAGMVDRHV